MSCRPSRRTSHYEIPDTATISGWTETNPKVHYDKAVDAQRAYNDEWKGLVRMMKKWNNQRNKPIKPSFLIEVMALEILKPSWGGDYRREMQAFFATLADRIHETWPDPAGLGPRSATAWTHPRSSFPARNSVRQNVKRRKPSGLERDGKQGAALDAWRALFGPLFPLS